MTNNQTRRESGACPNATARIAGNGATAALCAALLLGCGGSDESRGSHVPPELVGQWQTAISVAPADLPDALSYPEIKKYFANMPDGSLVQSSTLGIAETSAAT